MITNKEQIRLAIENAKKDQQGAFTFLLDTFWKQVFESLFIRTKNKELTEDLTIKTFSKAFFKIHSYNPKYSFKNWLFSIAKNLHIDEIRKQREVSFSLDKFELSGFDISDQTLGPEDQLILKQRTSILEQSLQKLPYHYQRVIKLRYVEDLSYREIANQLGEPINNIKVKLNRAKKVLIHNVGKNK